jgi:hypothetical protein
MTFSKGLDSKMSAFNPKNTINDIALHNPKATSKLKYVFG